MELAIIGALIAVVLTGIGATIGEWQVAEESLEILGKNPSLAGVLKSITILGIALVESAAIYGLVVALLILFTAGIGAAQAIVAGATIGGVGLFTCLTEAKVVKKALAAIFRNPEAEGEIKTNMILFVALVESAAIYALVTALLVIFA